MSIRALLLDLSGVLYQGEHSLPGAGQCIQAARERGMLLRFVTNTATKSREELLGKLSTLGLKVLPEELFTAPDAAKAYTSSRNLTPYALVHPSIEPLFEKNSGDYNCVILGDARNGLNYTTLNKAFRLLMSGCPLIGIGDNRYFQDDAGLSLDAGPFIHALSYASGVTPIIMGKPSTDFFSEVVLSTGLSAEECLMVGDDIFGDVEGALNAGVEAVLVGTGKYQAGDERHLSKPVPLIDSIQHLIEYLES